MTKNYIGIDIGTSETKVILIDNYGEVLSQQSARYSILMPHTGWMEMEAETWHEAVVSCVHKLADVTDLANIDGIGLTGQMHSTVFLDAEGYSIRPAILWNDLRSLASIPRLKTALADYGQLPYIERIIATGSPAANLLWLKENEPENFARLHRFVIGSNYIAAKLTGNYVTDYTQASTSSLYDIQKRQWASFMIDLLGLAKNVFPVVTGSAQPAGALRPEIAAALGLTPGIKVVAGAGDNPSAALSSGIFSDTLPLLSLGTAGVYTLLKKDIGDIARGKPILFSLDSQEFHYIVQGTIDACATALNWLTNTIFEVNDFAVLEDNINSRAPACDDLLFYPHLMGDKTIHADPTLRGAFFGLSANVTRVDMFRAVLEGISFAIRQLRDTLHIDHSGGTPLKTIGGGSKSQVWMQILADVLRQPIGIMDRSVSAAAGAAMMAAGLTHKGIAPKELVMPNEAMTRYYDKKFQKYLRVYDALKSVNSI